MLTISSDILHCQAHVFAQNYFSTFFLRGNFGTKNDIGLTLNRSFLEKAKKTLLKINICVIKRFLENITMTFIWYCEGSRWELIQKFEISLKWFLKWKYAKSFRKLSLSCSNDDKALSTCLWWRWKRNVIYFSFI